MKNSLTFDVEDWYQVVYERMVGEETTPSAMVLQNMEIILSLLAEHGAKATFFVMGKVAETYPGLVKTIHQQGHEIASHGYAHKITSLHTPESFRADLRLSLDLLQDITGTKVLGFRAPLFSVTLGTLWALPILKQEGIEYDSSIFPILHRRYGIPTVPRFPYEIEVDRSTRLVEFPLSTYSFGKINLPFCGGGYMRLLPWYVIRRAIHKLNLGGEPSIIYFHPYEFTKEKSLLKTGCLAADIKFQYYRILQNIGRSKTEMKLEKLLTHFTFRSVKEVLDEYRQYKNPTLLSFKGGTI